MTQRKNMQQKNFTMINTIICFQYLRDRDRERLRDLLRDRLDRLDRRLDLLRDRLRDLLRENEDRGASLQLPVSLESNDQSSE